MCPTLCDPVDNNLPGSTVHGILQAKILEPVAISSPGDLPNPGIELVSLESPALAGGFFATGATMRMLSFFLIFLALWGLSLGRQGSFFLFSCGMCNIIP